MIWKDKLKAVLLALAIIGGIIWFCFGVIDVPDPHDRLTPTFMVEWRGHQKGVCVDPLQEFLIPVELGVAEVTEADYNLMNLHTCFPVGTCTTLLSRETDGAPLVRTYWHGYASDRWVQFPEGTKIRTDQYRVEYR